MCNAHAGYQDASDYGLSALLLSQTWDAALLWMSVLEEMQSAHTNNHIDNNNNNNNNNNTNTNNNSNSKAFQLMTS